MYRLMIIDDESVVREGIKTLIPWADYQFEICAEGVDGKDGLKKIMEYSPDLVLIDIKMPGMMGIDVIKEARERGFQGKFTILTGYADFKYAKTAILLGVRAYLLKPIDEDELIQNVEDVLEELEAKKQQDAYYTIQELKSRQEIIYRLLMEVGTDEKINQELRVYGLDLNYKSFCVALLVSNKEYLSLDDPEYEDKVALALYGIDSVEKLFVDNQLVVVYKGGTYKELIPKLMVNNDRIQERFGEGFFITVGQDVVSWNDLHFSYETARYLAQYKFLYQEKKLITIEVFEKYSEADSANFAEEIQSYIEIGDIEAVSEVIKNRSEYYKSNLMKESDIKILVAHNMILLQNMIERRHKEKKDELLNFYSISKRIMEAESVDKLQNEVIEFSKNISEIIGTSGIDNVVMRMHAYMQNNYDKDIKIESIAKMMNYNSAYLGKIYKKKMGMSFNNMLDEIRIQNAKRLLEETDIKVYQVSKQIGYGNIDYFYAKFKKYVGVTPKKYKAMHNPKETLLDTEE